MEDVKSFKDLPIQQLQSYLAKNEQPFEKSQLYSSATDSKFVDEQLRQSVFRNLVEPEVFTLVEGIVANFINVSDTNHSYQLIRNDITHIKYEEGGFFKRHSDYLSATSNMIQEFTLIICVSEFITGSNVKGGNTILHTYGGSQVFDTTTPGCGLLFRKDLEHEGGQLLNGKKEIITCNLWAMRKNVSDQIFVVTFPKQRLSTSKEILFNEIVKKSTSYVLPVALLKGMLKTYVEWENRKAIEKGDTIDKVIVYECIDFSYEAFDLIYNILNRAYVDEEKLKNGKALLDYFGPFKMENLFVNLAIENKNNTNSNINNKENNSNLNNHDNISSQEEVKAKETQAQEQQQQQEQPPSTTTDNFFYENNDLIVCENEVRMRAIFELAKDHNLPYAPFKIMFCEGNASLYGSSGCSICALPMSAVGCLIGDQNHIFSLSPVSSKPYFYQTFFNSPQDKKDFGEMIDSADTVGPDYEDKIWKEGTVKQEKVTLSDVQDKYNIWEGNEWFSDTVLQKLKAQANAKEDKKIDFYDGCHQQKVDMYEYISELDVKSFGFGLRAAFGDVEDGGKSCVSNFVFQSEYRSSSFQVCFPSNLENDASKLKLPPRGALYHFDQNGKIVFTDEEAKKASDHIASSDLEDRVKKSLQRQRFELPQERGKLDLHFCNEAVYGKLNLLWVCGLIRLEDRKANENETVFTSDDDEEEKIGLKRNSKEVEFDCWPSKQAKQCSEHVAINVIKLILDDDFEEKNLKPELLNF